jgi:hypothetical protein
MRVSVLLPLKDNPGGTLPLAVHDSGGDRVPVMLKANVTGVPTVALAGLVWDVASSVAPAKVCMTPRDVAPTNADLSMVPSGETITISSATARTLSTGVRWSSAMRMVEGRFSQNNRRCRYRGIFMTRDE